MSCDLQDIFLENPMSRAEYTRIHSKYFPLDIRERYHIHGLVAADEYFYIKMDKGVYGIKHESSISYNQILSHMDTHG